MFTQIFSIDHYVINAAALAPLLTGVVIAFLGILFAVRENGSRVAMPFTLMAGTAASWLLGGSAAQSAVNVDLASGWLHAAHLGLIGLPISFLWFTHNVAGPLPHAQRVFQVAMAVTVVLMVSLATGFISDVRGEPAGYVYRYGLPGIVFAVFYLTTMFSAFATYMHAMRRAGASDTMRRRTRLLSISALLGATFAFSFLPAHGVPIYFGGHWILACFFLLTSYVTWRYRISDITPAFVGAQIARTMTDALVVLDRDGVMRMANPAACRLLGQSSRDLVGTSVDELLGGTLFSEQIAALMGGHEIHNLELNVDDHNGRARTLSVSASSMQEHGRQPKAFVFILHDISSRKKAEERIRELAYYDDLTGLPNRAECNSRLSQQLLQARRGNGALSVLYLDLDRFKRINDTLGHGAGDRLLGIVAERLSHCLRKDSHLRSSAESFVARLGGDEFVVCLSTVNDIKSVSAICTRLRDVLSQPIDLNGQEVFAGASIGVSRFPYDGNDAQALLQHADTALYEAKDSGRNNFVFYHDGLDANNRERLTLEADIRKALDNNEFHIHYQPLVDQRSGRIKGAEALLRWHHATRGNVEPDQFVPVAEDAGLICELGERVLAEACAVARTWHDLGFDDMHICINVSERQFRRDNLLEIVDAALAEAGLPARFLTLELTESIVMRDVEETVATLDALKHKGVSISIDDFGTGYSSLGYLKRFPIDVLKVDGNFTKGVSHNPNDAAITRAIISMARNLRLEVVAEGVENAAQVAFLQAEDCHIMQGYLFSAPVPAATFVRLLQAQAAPGVAPGAQAMGAGVHALLPTSESHA